MRLNLCGRVLRVLKDTVVQWMEDQPFQLAAALSYYTLFSLAPLLVIVISIAGFAFGRDAAQNRIVETIQGLVGRESAAAIQAIIQNASSKPDSGFLSTMLGLIILLVGCRRRCWPASDFAQYHLGRDAEGRPRYLGLSAPALHFFWPGVRNRFSSIGISGGERLADGVSADSLATCSAPAYLSPMHSILSFR
jgi:hypothetical protein